MLQAIDPIGVRVRLVRGAQQFLQELNGHCETDTGGLAQRRLFGIFDKNHIDDSDDRAGFDVVQRAAAVAWVSGRVELKDRKRPALQSPDQTFVELLRRYAG